MINGFNIPQVQNISQPSVWFVADNNGLQPETISLRLEHSAVTRKRFLWKQILIVFREDASLRAWTKAKVSRRSRGNKRILLKRRSKSVEVEGRWQFASLVTLGNKKIIKKMIKTLFSIGVLIQNITLTLLNPPIKLETLQKICSRYHSRDECEADCELSASHAPLSVDDLIRYRKKTGNDKTRKETVGIWMFLKIFKGNNWQVV